MSVLAKIFKDCHYDNESISLMDVTLTVTLQNPGNFHPRAIARNFFTLRGIALN
jgi:hypothetical protein